MISDVLTVMWKDLKEFLLQRSSMRATLGSMMIMILVFGVFLPLQSGREWLTSPISMVAWVWVPLFLVSGIIADSFAGERERHTLETLLASRLSDSAILLGKLAAGIAYGLGMTITLLLISALTVNLATWDGRPLFYPLPLLVTILFFGILATGLIAAIGVLVSLRAATVRQAAQSLSIGIVIVVWVPILTLQFLPRDVQDQLFRTLEAMDVRLLIGGVLGLLALVDVLLLAVSLSRFPPFAADS